MQTETLQEKALQIFPQSSRFSLWNRFFHLLLLKIHDLILRAEALPLTTHFSTQYKNGSIFGGYKKPSKENPLTVCRKEKKCSIIREQKSEERT
jgi:hypothetical protein